MFAEFGESVFEETSAFDEMEILRENISYLISTLDLEGLDIELSDSAEQKIQDETCPGDPYIMFRTESSVSLKFINQQPNKPFFELSIPIYKGDDVQRVADRIRRENRAIKGWSRFTFGAYIQY
jgi:leucyl-tRNA synthetase